MSTELTKIDVAKAQLEEALRLRLADGNSVAIHTLAYAAFGILRDLINHRAHPMKDVLAILEDHASKMGRQFWQVPNSLKHADRNPDFVLESHCDKDVHLTLAFACRLWVELGNPETELMQKFAQLPDPYKHGLQHSAFLNIAQGPQDEKEWRALLDGAVTTTSS
jgi:hypothetical protein